MTDQKQSKETLKIRVSDTIKVRDSIGLKTFVGNTRKFIVHIISGWFPSERADLSPEGVNKERLIDRKNKKYKEKVIDVKTGRVIRDVEQNLSEHK